MGNAFWLFFALPDWYFSTILNPLSAGILSAVPAIGTICLVAGLTIASIKRQPQVIIFLISPMFSQLFAAVAGALRGDLRGTSDRVIIAFLVLQLALVGYLVYRLKGARLGATALAVFCMTYALFAAFVASMAFNDTWL